MIAIQLPDRETEIKGRAFLVGRFSGKVMTFSRPKSCNELSHSPAIGYGNEAFFRFRGWVCQHVVKRIRRCPVAVCGCVKKIRCMT